MEKEINVEYVPLSKIEKWPRNPKLHDTELLGASVERFGFVQPVIMDERSGRLVAGHGRLETLRKMKDAGKKPPGRIKVADGEWLVPVVRGVSFSSDKEAEAYLVADNRHVELGGWDEKALAEMLREQEVDLAGVGFTSDEINAMLSPKVDLRPPQAERKQDIDAYYDSDIKQIVLYFDSVGFDDIVARLGRVMQAKGLNSHTQAFMKLLEAYESSSS